MAISENELWCHAVMDKSGHCNPHVEASNGHKNGCCNC